MDEPEPGEIPDVEDAPEAGETLRSVLERQFMKRATIFKRPKKSEFETLLKRVLNRLVPGICIQKDLMDDLYRAGVNLLQVVNDWDGTMKAINSPAFTATERYLDDQMLKAAKFYRALREDRKSKLPESVFGWHRRNTRNHFFILKSGRDYLTELGSLTKLGRTKVLSRLLWYQYDSLKSRLKGTPFARRRSSVLVAFTVAILPRTKGKNLQPLLAMRIKRAGESEIWAGKSLANQMLLSLQLYAEIASDEAGL
jgi:hypothetical protein